MRAVLTTEDPALIYDYRSGRIVLEVLIVAGAVTEEQTPLIRDHNQYSVTSIVGSVTEHAATGDALEGWLSFGEELDDISEGIWRRVAQGHLRRVSVGYDYTNADYVTITAGETQMVGGRSFTAPDDRDLRVVRSWRLREVSLVVVPADPRAQTRETARGTFDDESANSTATANAADATAPSYTGSRDEDEMKKFLKFLHKHGLATSVTNTEEALSWAAKGNLTATQLDELEQLCREDGVTFQRSAARAKTEVVEPTRSAASETGTQTGTQSGTQTTTEQRAATQSNPIDQRAAADAAVAAERQRVAGIRALHRDHPTVPAEVVERAESEGWDLQRTTSEFLTAIRDSRQPAAPAGHIRGSEQVNLRVLQAALLEREGITPDSPVFQHQAARSVGRRRDMQADWLVGVPQTGERRDAMEQVFDVARQRGLGNLSLFRAAELLGELETGVRLHDEQEILERAFSSGGFGAVFGSVVHLQMLAGYAATPATYREFCEVLEVGDLREHKDADMGAVGRLKKQGKNGGQAELLNVDDPVLVSARAERYAGLLKVTDQVIINDSFGVAGMLPRELGETCQQMIIDLAFAQILSTANLADSSPRYHADHGNLISDAAFDGDTLTALGPALKAKKVGDRRIVVQGAVLVAGTTQAPNVIRQVRSATIGEAANPHQGAYGVVEDTAIDLGVLDPAQNDLAIAGRPNSVYAFAGGSKRSVAAVFRRGTNQGPVTRSGMLTQGEWGMYWDVFMDCGAAFRRRIGTARIDITG